MTRKAASLREEAGMTLRDVEAETGLDHSTIGKLETGGNMLLQNLEILSALYTRKLGRPITIDELIALEEVEQVEA